MVNTDHSSATHPDYPRTIRGAVLQDIGRARPYATSQPIVVREVHLNRPGPGEIMVRIEAAGICHSDLSVVDGNRPRPVPMLLGHEAAGIVEELGVGVTDLALGDRVVMTFLPRCGDCTGCRSNGKTPCEIGTLANSAGELLGGATRLSVDGKPLHHHLGVSGFATHAVVSRRSVVRVGSDVPAPVAAIFGCALLTGGGAVLNVLNPQPGESLAVVGLGGVGMAAVVTAVATGVERIVGVDSQPAKLEMAQRLGATEVYTPEEAASAGVKVSGAIEAAGHPRALESAIALTAPGGTTVTVGLPAPKQVAYFDPLALVAEARSVVGSYLGSAVPEIDIPIYETLWREGRLDVDGLISSTIDLDAINEAMDTLADGRALRQIITFHEGSPA
ncbi:alcohol dehydrogenase catalytic domain-containing protein [Rhodococcus rhodochrous]|uniref:Alcohol dehydrogenase catalytic domain-containing protein n=1 Tax=Rhodococcus rhodochrous TaxID=1829 RepID=A0AA47AE14_RHORH|nr:alcohol dehydrogenase catalytic domain-containing protein [Rhodococcus rhodochrous]UZF48321.1 alcohol dehydrogenase catalytic domain-containing protein [Rhodococcus rhodochrous]